MCVDPRRCCSLRAPAGGDGVDVRPCESGFADGFLDEPRGVDPFFEPERGVVPLDGRERGDAGRPLRDGEVVGIARCDAQNSRHQKVDRALRKFDRDTSIEVRLFSTAASAIF